MSTDIVRGKNIYLLSIAITLNLFIVSSLHAGEGASSNYFPATYGDYAVAVPPNPGLTYINYNLFYSAEADRAVLQGRIETDLDTFAYVNMSTLIYTFEKPVLGGLFATAAFIPISYVDLDVNLVGELTSSRVDDSETGLGDMIFMPFSGYWNTGNFYFNLYELVTVPTGEYDIDNNVNLSRNYWSFDTVLAITYLNMETGREFSLVPGFMINTKNNDTDYRTGSEFHLDAMFNQFFSETFALGLHGYYFKQVVGDSGSGAILGDFKGESYGIGPSLLWTPKVGRWYPTITANWLHDLGATNQLKGDYVVITLVWQFGVIGK
jgi:hypothetical protein